MAVIRTRDEWPATMSTTWRMWLALPVGIAACGAVAFLFVGAGKFAPSERGVCWVSTDQSHFSELDEVDNLETCGARLEVVYRRKPRLVRGAYGGVFVFVDSQGIDAAAPNGPKTQLLSHKSREEIDADIDKLLNSR